MSPVTTERKKENQSTTLVALVREALQECPYPQLRKLSCEWRHGSLILQGRVSSYYMKQLAQVTVQSICEELSFINKIRVVKQEKSELQQARGNQEANTQ